MVISGCIAAILTDRQVWGLTMVALCLGGMAFLWFTDKQAIENARKRAQAKRKSK